MNLEESWGRKNKGFNRTYYDSEMMDKFNKGWKTIKTIYSTNGLNKNSFIIIFLFKIWKGTTYVYP